MSKPPSTAAPSAATPSAAARPRSLEARLRDHYAALPDSERKLADVILDFPGEIAAYSATELARLAGVSKAAGSRLFKRLGFENYEEARRLARDTQAWGSPLYLVDKQVAGRQTASEIPAFLDDHQQVLARAFEALDPGEVDAMTERLASCERLWLLGFRNSYFVAAYARWQFIQSRPDVRLLPQPGETLAEYIAEFTPKDLLFAFGFRRRVAGLKSTLAAAAGRGTPILYMSDPADARAEKLATWRIGCEVATGRAFDSYVGAIGLVQFLSVMAMKKAGKAGRTRLEAIELAHEALSDFG